MGAINNMPEAEKAYDQCLATLAAAHRILNAAASPPADWGTYRSALASCGAAQAAAEAALSVFQTAILDAPAVADLRQKLSEDTDAMKARTADLAATKVSLDAVTGVATNMTNVAGAISRFV